MSMKDTFSRNRSNFNYQKNKHALFLELITFTTYLFVQPVLTIQK